MDISQISQSVVTSLEELQPAEANAAQVADFDHAMSNGADSLGGSFLSEIGHIKEQFTEAKEALKVQLSTPGDDPNILMQMQWSLMRISMQEELIAKTVGRMSQNVETLMKTQ
ncbi:type III secretion system inner rod subunit SctI [Pseudomonas lundensis]|uniref:type III secretion system inner rod subunit SctI n=1 Tax=Pseudomonas lundensis TaxID=86185 RepID=UPI001472B4FA|nr:type III secretion system inner rod subunit SctI [Pseudomonas lundensis]NNA22913.1 type III secretion system inner rod subunit SctI [Pseudomonas lundensis]